MSDDKLTIVGPEPTGPEDKTPPKKVNIEALLLMAKYDEGFKKKLFEDRDKALSESGIDFTPGEKLLLTNISADQLAENIKEFRMPGVTKKSLPSWAKAAAVILLLSSMVLVDADGITFANANDKGSASVKVKVRIPRSMGITRDYGGPPSQNSRITEVEVVKNDFTRFTVFTPEMLKALNEIKLKLSSEISIDDIIKEYDSIISKESDVQNTEKTITPEAVKMMDEIKGKIGSGMDADDMIKKYEEIVYDKN